jgi:hypothetical protein
MQIFFKFDTELNGLKTIQGLFHTKEGKNFTKFKNWNFTDPSFWDSNE